MDQQQAMTLADFYQIVGKQTVEIEMLHKLLAEANQKLSELVEKSNPPEKN